MKQPNKTETEFVREVERLAEAWESSLEKDGRLSHVRKQAYGYSVRQFIRWLKEGAGRNHLPRSLG